MWHPTMKPLWRRTVEYGVAMKSVSRATWRDGAHLDSAVDLRDRVGNDPAGRLLATALSIRPSWYHSLDTNHNAPLPPPIHPMVQIYPSELGSAHEPLDLCNASCLPTGIKITASLRFPSRPLSWA